MSAVIEAQVAGKYSNLYSNVKEIGKGGYGSVYSAYRRFDRRSVVMKAVLKSKIHRDLWVSYNTQKVTSEIALLSQLEHPNLVKMLEYFENDNYFQIIMDGHGTCIDLFALIELRPYLDEAIISYIFRQVGCAVQYLHSLRVVHRDIKDENIIINTKFQIKLIDFGSAALVTKNILFTSTHGTKQFYSPEVVARQKYCGFQLDMWTLGVTLYLLVFFEMPFESNDEIKNSPILLKKPVSEGLVNILQGLLNKCQHSRWSIAQLMASEWLQQTVDIAKYNFLRIISGNLDVTADGFSATESSETDNTSDSECEIIEVESAPATKRPASGYEL